MFTSHRVLLWLIAKKIPSGVMTIPNTEQTMTSEIFTNDEPDSLWQSSSLINTLPVPHENMAQCPSCCWTLLVWATLPRILDILSSLGFWITAVFAVSLTGRKKMSSLRKKVEDELKEDVVKAKSIYSSKESAVQGISSRIPAEFCKMMLFITSQFFQILSLMGTRLWISRSCFRRRRQSSWLCASLIIIPKKTSR